MIDRLLQRLDLQARLLGEMMERLGVDPPLAARDASGAALAAAACRCRGCGAAEACRGFLDQAGEAPAAPEFCPNGDFLARHGNPLSQGGGAVGEGGPRGEVRNPPPTCHRRA